MWQQQCNGNMNENLLQGDIMKGAIIKQTKTLTKVKTIRSEDFREITQDRFFCGIREGFFIYVIQNEKFNTNDEEEEPIFVDEIQVKVPPQQIVKTYELLGNVIQQYETIFGDIRTLEKVASDSPDLVEES